ncbi:MAG: multidrug transporter AcrB [Bdellovibrionales bacterium RIFCSPHIGHO2_01_FULL_40_29]|nr:MAG: multidrug transporter AcrB [Bdellovibrionales bacterium RIFCSPHIGHO2_01_FULL_40_29]OFZ33550.1 MAG: multidrug transporter AcrB [Bdellovibrionales bacterium RIFCSPHIGHO2_02_FULL_40_15]
MKNNKLGFAGKLAQTFVHSKLTPVIAISSLLLGLMAVYLTPKEEEPQISVPMIDIRTAAPGFTAEEAERKVTEPIERAVWGLDGVEYVYSTSQPHGSLVTVRFKVGEPMEPSLVKIHHKLMTIQNELPGNVLPSQVKSFSIDDVPFLVLTFTSKKMDEFALRSAVAPLARELSSTPDLSKVELLGGQKRAIRVIADPQKMQAHGVSLLALMQSLKTNDALAPSGKNWSQTEIFDVEVGGRLHSGDEVGNLAIGQRAGRVVFIKDVAQVLDGPEEIVRSSVLLEKNQEPEKAVSIVFSKRKGTNVVTLSREILERADTFLKKQSEGNDLRMTVVRDYGSTAADKSNELIEHLLLATLSVSALIALFMGIRASLVVATAIPVTLALTLAIYYFMGYTLNRVTLFALIFSIGILVDDAIVVVENIERHLKENMKDGLLRATIKAVNEVGNPTILATFTVIAAILPMAFVRGLMGPYMKPIPVGASFAMMLSLFVAFIVTPWAAVKLLKAHHHDDSQTEAKVSRLDQLYQKVMETLLGTKKYALLLGAFTITLLLAASSLVYFKSVKVKMLPFDNKQEFQVLIDYPVATPLLIGKDWSIELAREILKNKEVESVQVFAGEASPYSFSGMVKHTFLRGSDYQNDLQIVLTEKGNRKISSHEIIESLRPLIKNFAIEKKAITKVLEIPPGPPVLATMMAEIYGPDVHTREKVTKEIEAIFANEPSVVDLDTTLRLGRSRKVYEYDQAQGGLFGTNSSELMALGRLAFSETPVTTLANVNSPEDVSVDLSLAQSARSSEHPFVGLRIPSFETGTVEANQVLKPVHEITTKALYRKNLKPVSYVMSELSGSEEAPVYGIFKLAPQIKYPLQTADVPWNTVSPVVKWDGEWFITYEVFRDLGGAFAVVMVLIYILVLGWFKSFTVPLIIMAPIPISLIGILPGHAIMGSYFTATSMIGFIAGAGIIVRNSIILVDFIEHQLGLGMSLKKAVVSAGVLRFRPMLLTAAAVVVGSSVMLADPIFQGLAVSLIFGEIAATILSRFAVPVLYYWFVGKSRVSAIRAEINNGGE